MVKNVGNNAIKFAEFLESVKKAYLIENLGGFISWMKRNHSISSKLPSSVWQGKLDEYLKRKI
jgi:hypothetical protein